MARLAGGLASRCTEATALSSSQGCARRRSLVCVRAAAAEPYRACLPETKSSALRSVANSISSSPQTARRSGLVPPLLSFPVMWLSREAQR